MYDEVLIRRVCRQISQETDERKVGELASLLRTIIQNDFEEIQLRMAFLRKRYAIIFEQTGNYSLGGQVSSPHKNNYEWPTMETGEVAL